MDQQEIYNQLCKSIIDNSPESWVKAILNIEVQPKYSAFNGAYETKNGDKEINVFDFPIETGDTIIVLHKLTAEGSNKWNRAQLIVIPDKRFNIEFIWDQEWQDRMDRHNQQETEKDPSYASPKWHWEE